MKYIKLSSNRYKTEAQKQQNPRLMWARALPKAQKLLGSWFGTWKSWTHGIHISHSFWVFVQLLLNVEEKKK